MKFLNLTLSLFLCITLISCSEDELGIDNTGNQDSNPTKTDTPPDNNSNNLFTINEQNLIGTWNLISSEREHTTVYLNNGKIDYTEKNGGYSKNHKNLKFKFNSDKNFTLTGILTDVYYSDVDGTTVDSGEEIVNENDGGTWVLEGNVLKLLWKEYLEFNDPAEEYTITPISNNRIEIYSYYYDEDPEYFTETFEYRIVLEKE